VNLLVRNPKLTPIIVDISTKKRVLTLSNKIGCKFEHLVLENAAAKLNTSIQFVKPEDYLEEMYYVVNDPMHFTALVIFTVVHFVETNRSIDDIDVPHEAFFQYFYHHEKIVRLFYCTKLHERENFSFLFWTIPFDSSSWILLLGFCILMTLVMKGEWIQVCAIFLRQGCTTLEKQKSLVLIILIAIVITCVSESIISSLTTIPDPFLVYNNLKDLLNNGYKVMSGGSTDGFPPIFLRENITEYSVEDSVFLTQYNTHDKYYAETAKCNTTMLMYQFYNIAWMTKLYPCQEWLYLDIRSRLSAKPLH